MHLAVVFQHYNNPDCDATARHFTLLAHWVRRYRVTLIASRAWADRRLSERFPWVPEGVALRSIDVPYTNQMGPRERVGAFARFAVQAFREARGMERPDLFVGVSTPLTAPAAAALAARHHRVPWVMEVKDLWPDFPVAMGSVPGVAAPLLYRLERALYRSAAHVVAYSPDMAAHVARTVPAERVTTTYNGTDPSLVEESRTADLEALRAAHGLGDGPVVLYAGTFGRANNVPLLLRLARRLGSVPGARLVCIGDGYGRAALEAETHRLPALRIVAPQPRHAAFPWFRLADLSVVSFNDLAVLGTNSPAKLFDSLACGTPAVVVNDGWMRRLVDDHGCGFYAPAADPEGVADAVVRALADRPRLDAMAGRATALAEGRPDLFDRTRHAADYETLFERVVAEHRR